VSLDPSAPGLVEQDVFESIYNPGKLMVKGSWVGPSDAARFQPARIFDASTVRHRAVRIIRDYGMFDRRETPQYYPEVEQDPR
jgi:hypothetical protein